MIGNNHVPTSEDAPSTNVNTGYGGLWLKPHNFFDEDHTRDLRETTLYTT
jgi:Cu2+-containing amine oxidase